MSTTLMTRTRFEDRARELMHQSALLTLDMAIGRTREDLVARLDQIQESLFALLVGLNRGDPLPEPNVASYWEHFSQAKRHVCEKCVFFRSGYVPEVEGQLAEAA